MVKYRSIVLFSLLILNVKDYSFADDNKSVFQERKNYATGMTFGTPGWINANGMLLGDIDAIHLSGNFIGLYYHESAKNDIYKEAGLEIDYIYFLKKEKYYFHGPMIIAYYHYKSFCNKNYYEVKAPADYVAGIGYSCQFYGVYFQAGLGGGLISKFDKNKQKVIEYKPGFNAFSFEIGYLLLSKR